MVARKLRKGVLFCKLQGILGATSTLKPRDDEVVDVFFDGSLILVDTRGHSRGHQSVIVSLPKSGRIVLAGDAVQVADNLREGILPRDMLEQRNGGEVHRKAPAHAERRDAHCPRA